MRVISENIANADSTAPTAGGDPYRRKVPTFSSALDRTLDAKVVTLGKVRPDQSAFRVKYEPSNPASDVAGNVKYPFAIPAFWYLHIWRSAPASPAATPGPPSASA
jgi:flagellar basal-body rod protein FlgC